MESYNYLISDGNSKIACFWVIGLYFYNQDSEQVWEQFLSRQKKDSRTEALWLLRCHKRQLGCLFNWNCSVLASEEYQVL